MNEVETRAEHIDPTLQTAGWGVTEAKAWDVDLTEGVAQAKNYASKLSIRFAYSTNGQGIIGLKWTDVDWEGSQLRIDSPKTGLRFIPIFPEI